MSYIFDKEVNVQKENLKNKNTSGVHAGSHTPMKKCAMKMKQRNKEKRRACKSVFDGRKHFIGHIRKTGENDLNKLHLNNSGHNKGTICLVNG